MKSGICWKYISLALGIVLGATAGGCGGASSGGGTTKTLVAPTIAWSAPSAIVYGTALSATQLNATASVAGTFSYSPALGSILAAGTQSLSVSFMPSDTADYAQMQASVSLLVNKALPPIAWATPQSIAAGSVLTTAQLNATSPVGGKFTYSPSAGTTETVPGSLTMQTIFVPTDTADYLSATATNSLTLTTAGPPSYPAYAWTNVLIGGGGYVDGIYFHPTAQNLIYLKTDIGGAYRWSPATSRWIPLLDWVDRSNGSYFLTNYWGTDALALDPTDPNYLYLAVGIGSGGIDGNFLISHDQGGTFTNVSLPFTVGSNDGGRSGGERLAVDPNMPSRIYFGTKVNGLWYSDNHGLTWSQNTSFPALSTANQQGVIFVLPVKSSGTAGSLSPVIFAGVAENTTTGTFNSLYVSTNAGASWTPVTGQPSGTLLPWRGRLGPGNELYVTYNNVVGPDSATTGMICSLIFTNAGAVTQIANITPPLPSGATTTGFSDVEADPEVPGTLVAATIDSSSGVDSIYRSTNDGAAWVSMSNDTHDITTAPWVTFKHPPGTAAAGANSNWINLAIDPFSSDHAIYGTGQMVYETQHLTYTSASTPVPWVEKILGQEELVINALIAPPSGPSVLVSGAEDVDGFAHTSVSVSPPGGTFSSPYNGATVGLDFSEANPSLVVRVGGSNGLPVSAAPYGGYSLDGANTWTAFGNTPLPNSTVGGGSIAVSPDSTASSMTLVWSPHDAAAPTVYSTNRGSSWTASAGAPAASQVASDRVNANKFYVFNGGLYESTNKGQSFSLVTTGVGSIPNSNLFTSFAREEDIWIASATNGLYRNTSKTIGTITLTAVAGINYAYSVVFGAPKPGSGQPYTVYVAGYMQGQHGIFRSVDGGTTWQEIDDQQHRWGYINCLAADRNTFGTLYVGTYARGIQVGTSAY